MGRRPIIIPRHQRRQHPFSKSKLASKMESLSRSDSLELIAHPLALVEDANHVVEEQPPSILVTTSSNSGHGAGHSTTNSSIGIRRHGQPPPLPSSPASPPKGSSTKPSRVRRKRSPTTIVAPLEFIEEEEEEEVERPLAEELENDPNDQSKSHPNQDGKTSSFQRIIQDEDEEDYSLPENSLRHDDEDSFSSILSPPPPSRSSSIGEGEFSSAFESSRPSSSCCPSATTMSSMLFPANEPEEDDDEFFARFDRPNEDEENDPRRLAEIFDSSSVFGINTSAIEKVEESHDDIILGHDDALPTRCDENTLPVPKKASHPFIRKVDLPTKGPDDDDESTETFRQMMLQQEEQFASMLTTSAGSSILTTTASTTATASTVQELLKVKQQRRKNNLQQQEGEASSSTSSSSTSSIPNSKPPQRPGKPPLMLPEEQRRAALARFRFHQLIHTQNARPNHHNNNKQANASAEAKSSQPSRVPTPTAPAKPTRASPNMPTPTAEAAKPTEKLPTELSPEDSFESIDDELETLRHSTLRSTQAFREESSRLSKDLHDSKTVVKALEEQLASAKAQRDAALERCKEFQQKRDREKECLAIETLHLEILAACGAHEHTKKRLLDHHRASVARGAPGILSQRLWRLQHPESSFFDREDNSVGHTTPEHSESGSPNGKDDVGVVLPGSRRERILHSPTKHRNREFPRSFPPLAATTDGKESKDDSMDTSYGNKSIEELRTIKDGLEVIKETFDRARYLTDSSFGDAGAGARKQQAMIEGATSKYIVFLTKHPC